MPASAAVIALVCAAQATAQQPVGAERTVRPPLGLDAYIAVPPDNPLTVAGIALGRRLFFDAMLSADGTISCATCHQPQRAFADSVARSAGARGARTRRNTPTLVNAAYGRSFSWDGRAASLEEQMLRPIEDPLEMGSRVDDVVARLQRDSAYAHAFAAAYGQPPTRSTLARALASFTRTILSGNSVFDRFRAGDTLALSPLAREGFRLFTGRANCATCHVGPTFSDQRFHNTGVAWRSGTPADSGRFAVTHRREHVGAFKTPTLRDLERTAPYMHDGSIATLAEVIDFYDAGGFTNPLLDRDLRSLRLSSAEKRALLAYLASLAGTRS